MKYLRLNIDKTRGFTYSGFVGKYVRVIIAFLFVAVLCMLTACGKGSTVTPTPTVTGPQSQTLVSGDISVSAQTNFDYAFTVTAAMKQVNVSGKFNTFGGAPNHIEVYVMDDATYTNWLKGRTVHILFDSGLMSSGDVDQAITVPGKYHLIFTNYAPATLAAVQQVHTQFTLNWVY
jgi:hypothetical protein